MSVKHTLNGIEFTNIKTSSNIKLPQFTGSSIYQSTTEDLNEDFGVGGDLPTIVNAVEIDWNGAELGTINDINLGTINTTGDLLNAIKALANANKYAA